VGRLDGQGEGVLLGLELLSLLGRIELGLGRWMGQGLWLGGDRSVKGLYILVESELCIFPFLALSPGLDLLFLFPSLGLGLGHGPVPCSGRENHRGEAYKQKKTTNSRSNVAVEVVAAEDASSSLFPSHLYPAHLSCPSRHPVSHPSHRGTDRPALQWGGKYPDPGPCAGAHKREAEEEAGMDGKLGKCVGYDDGFFLSPFLCRCLVSGAGVECGVVHRTESPGAKQRRS
jgi:hypothetical protein